MFHAPTEAAVTTAFRTQKAAHRAMGSELGHVVYRYGATTLEQVLHRYVPLVNVVIQYMDRR